MVEAYKIPDRPLVEMPLETKAKAIGGGHWIKKKRGWKWCNSHCVFPVPGGDWNGTVFIPELKDLTEGFKILHLTLKRKWFDLISEEIKKEEYREIKHFWKKRLKVSLEEGSEFKKFDRILFKNGYAKDAPTILIDLKGIEVGTGKKEWGAEEGTEYFVLKLGEILYRS